MISNLFLPDRPEGLFSVFNRFQTARKDFFRINPIFSLI